MIIKNKNLSGKTIGRSGRYKEVHPEGSKTKDPSPLKVKEVWVGKNRYIVYFNSKQARKDAADRQAILGVLRQKLKSEVKSIIGNKGRPRSVSYIRYTLLRMNILS